MTDQRHRDRQDLRRPSPRVRRRRVIALLIVAVVFVGLLVIAIVTLAPHPQEAQVAQTGKPSAKPSASPSLTPSPTPSGFDKTQLSIDDPASIWVVVDKLRPLNPQNYAAPDLITTPVPSSNPPILRKEAADAVVAMFAAYQAETGLQMQVQSAYRSYDVQVKVYGGYAAKEGAAGADTHSARPGYSEHQTGLALDISALPANCTLDACFANTPQGQWLAANAWQYGFLLRYPNGLDSITGYTFEPWHYRYVGVVLATELHNEAVPSLEQFFGLPNAPGYAN